MTSFHRIAVKARARLLFIVLPIFFLFSFLIVQFYRLQILEESKWANHAQRQHFFVVKESFLRGTFYSNPYVKHNHPADIQKFVIDLPKFHLYADSESIPMNLKGEVVIKIASILNLSSKISQQIHGQLHKSSRSRKLLMWLDKGNYDQIYAWWRNYAMQHRIAKNALFFVKDYQRSYPFGKMLGQVLHTIRHQKEEKTLQALPTGGLELYFNKYLQGRQGKKRLMRSPRHSFETEEVIVSPQNGADIYLTINPVLQAIAEEEIENGVIHSRAKGGWAVMMDPKTGHILALAQYPFFNPLDYQRYFNNPDLIEHTKVKAVTDANEPGSVFKVFTVAIALKANQELLLRGEKELFSTAEKFATYNGRFPGRSKPITDTSLHHYLNMDMAMQKSSNIYMARLTERIIARMGNAWYRQALAAFGFGQKTNIELPAESSGVLPTPGKLHVNGTLEWSAPTPFSLAIGHNIQVNTIQLLRAYAVFANGGRLVQPTLVRYISKKDSDGDEIILIDNTQPEKFAAFPYIMDAESVKRVVQAMRFVTKPGGTAVKADIPGYTEAGKTSTPKKIVNGIYSEKLYCPIFAGFAPVNEPEFVLVVVMDEPAYGYMPGIGKNHNGGNCTANVFREIAWRALHYLGIPPDDPYGYPVGDPRRNIKKTEWIDEVLKLQEMYNKWNNILHPKQKAHLP